MDKQLTGIKIMIVEDEGLIAMDLEDELADCGATIVGSYRGLAEALPAAKSSTIDFAILDVNLGSETSYAIAEVLRSREVPFVFASGYDKSGLQSEWQDTPIARKPFNRAILLKLIGEQLGI